MGTMNSIMAWTY
jgi:hypothetical protein